MRISYGQSSILRCTIQLAYDRFFTSFNQNDEIQQAIASGDIINKSNDVFAGFNRGPTDSQKLLYKEDGLESTGFTLTQADFN